jgi:short chain dehydrogenase
MQVVDTAAVVTGGALGLGAATAAALAERGASVFVLDLEPALVNAPDVKGVTYLAADVIDPQSVAVAVAATTTGAGVPLRTVVNCAGIGPSSRILGPQRGARLRRLCEGHRGQPDRDLDRARTGRRADGEDGRVCQTRREQRPQLRPGTSPSASTPPSSATRQAPPAGCAPASTTALDFRIKSERMCERRPSKLILAL